MSGPVLQPSTLRAWKVFTAVACTFTGFQMIFRTDYGEKDHVFTPVQRWYTSQIDGLLGVDSEIARRLKAPATSLPIRVSTLPSASTTQQQAASSSSTTEKGR